MCGLWKTRKTQSLFREVVLNPVISANGHQQSGDRL